MKKFLKILAIALVLLVALGGMALYMLEVRKTEISSAVEPMLREMAEQDWARATVDKFASDDFKQALAKDGDAVLTIFSKLGSVKANNGIESFRYFTAVSGRTSVQAIFSIEFDQGPGKVTLQVSRAGETWLIDSLHINAPYLNNLLAKAVR